MTHAHQLRGLPKTYGNTVASSRNTSRAAIEAGLEVLGKKSVWQQPRRTKCSKVVTVSRTAPVGPLSHAEKKRRQQRIDQYR